MVVCMNIAKKIAPLLSFNEQTRLRCSLLCELSLACRGIEAKQLVALRLLEETPSGMQTSSLGRKVCLELDQHGSVSSDVVLKLKS